MLGPVNNVVLSYYPAPSEPAINLQGLTRPSISKTYKLSNRVVGEAFSIKLYLIPIWTGSKYRLAIRLTDLSYGANIDVTEYVHISRVDGTSFKGDQYGTQQHLNLTLNLDLPGLEQYSGFIHTQQVKITLNPPGPSNISGWVIDYGGDGYTYFGADKYIQANVIDDKEFRVDLNQSNITDWLSWGYWALDPLYNNAEVDRAPTPTHFKLEQGGFNGSRAIATYPIEDWDKELMLGRDREWEQGYPLIFTWLVRTGSTDKIVGVGAMEIKYIYNPDGD